LCERKRLTQIQVVLQLIIWWLEHDSFNALMTWNKKFSYRTWSSITICARHEIKVFVLTTRDWLIDHIDLRVINMDATKVFVSIMDASRTYPTRACITRTYAIKACVTQVYATKAYVTRTYGTRGCVTKAYATRACVTRGCATRANIINAYVTKAFVKQLMKFNINRSCVINNQ
jgi:hypothetical protein